jgi:hypothetical protein
MSETNKDESKPRTTRRAFIGAAGASLGAAGARLVLPAETTEAGERGRGGGRRDDAEELFTRMFRLPAFANNSRRLQQALLELGRLGGPLDAKDALDRGAAALLSDPSLSANNPDNPGHPAGLTFFGQFLDHDMTFDAASRLGRPTRLGAAGNSRTARFDLDSVYDDGPRLSPELYSDSDPAKFDVAGSARFQDLPRLNDGAAVIGDPRNDENLVISELHVAFLLFHNRAVDYVRERGATGDAAFTQARRLTTWHYHWLIANEFLPLVAGRETVSNVISQGRQFYTPGRGRALLPLEFQTGAYRFGHSMVRPSYQANLQGDNRRPFIALVLDPSQANSADPSDLSGGARSARRFIDWQLFFDFGDGALTRNKKIDAKISTPMLRLPREAIPAPGGPTSIAQRTFLRHITWSIPSGQRVAREMGATPLSGADLQDLRAFGLQDQTPLWYYVLKEAELTQGGTRLGPVGGRIVAEVILGLLQTDPASYFRLQPGWRPTLPSRQTGDFGMVDFLNFAGVGPASRRG